MLVTTIRYMPLLHKLSEESVITSVIRQCVSHPLYLLSALVIWYNSIAVLICKSQTKHTYSAWSYSHNARAGGGIEPRLGCIGELKESLLLASELSNSYCITHCVDTPYMRKPLSTILNAIVLPAPPEPGSSFYTTPYSLMPSCHQHARQAAPELHF